jgi:hypothetical protein
MSVSYGEWIRIARWNIFKPKIPIWVNFVVSCKENFMAIWSISLLFGIFYGHLVYFTAIWNILLPFGIFFPFWYVAPRKI